MPTGKPKQSTRRRGLRLGLRHHSPTRPQQRSLRPTPSTRRPPRRRPPQALQPITRLTLVLPAALLPPLRITQQRRPRRHARPDDLHPPAPASRRASGRHADIHPEAPPIASAGREGLPVGHPGLNGDHPPARRDPVARRQRLRRTPVPQETSVSATPVFGPSKPSLLHCWQMVCRKP